MTIEGFDYKDFAESLSQQASKVIPEDLDETAQGYLLNTMQHFTYLAGEALYNEFEGTAENAVFIVQVVGEWTFHKIVDLARSGIEQEHWDFVMQKIAFVIFEVTKTGIQRNLEEKQILDAVEHHVVKTYKESIEELYDEGKISKETLINAYLQSNIDTYSGTEIPEYNKTRLTEEEKKKAKKEKAKKHKKCFEFDSVHFTILSIIVLGIVLISAGLYFHVSEIILDKLFIKSLIPFLIITFLCKKSVGNWLIYLSLFLATICCSICILKTILNVSIYNVVISAIFIYWLIHRVSVFVQNLVTAQLEWFEKVRAEAHAELDRLTNPDIMFEKLGGDVVNLQIGSGLIKIADKKLVKQISTIRKELADELGYTLPDVRTCDNNSFEEFEYRIFIRGSQVEQGQVSPEEACEVILKHLKTCAIKYVDEIMTDTDVENYLEEVRKKIPSRIENLLQHISIYDLRNILASLIKDKFSIKDSALITFKLYQYINETTDVEVLTKKLKSELGTRAK